MRANRPVSRCELALRKELWRLGVRGYRVNARLPGRPDIALAPLRLAVFVNGCFWHACPVCRLPRPKNNAAFWQAKMDENVRRDAAALEALQKAGWESLIIWEHDLRRDLGASAAWLAAEITRRRAARRPGGTESPSAR